MTTKWIRIKDRLPVKGEVVLGFDTFHSDLHLCRYMEETTDEGTPWLEPVRARGGCYEPLGEDDCHITYWMQLPSDPNVEETC